MKCECEEPKWVMSNKDTGKGGEVIRVQATKIPVCPKCKSLLIESERWGHWIWYDCKACRHRWSERILSGEWEPSR